MMVVFLFKGFDIYFIFHVEIVLIWGFIEICVIMVASWILFYVVAKFLNLQLDNPFVKYIGFEAFQSNV